MKDVVFVFDNLLLHIEITVKNCKAKTKLGISKAAAKVIREVADEGFTVTLDDDDDLILQSQTKSGDMTITVRADEEALSDECKIEEYEDE